MKDFQNYTESPYIDMRNPFGFDGNFGCACNPCHRPPIPNCNTGKPDESQCSSYKNK